MTTQCQESAIFSLNITVKIIYLLNSLLFYIKSFLHLTVGDQQNKIQLYRSLERKE